MFTEDDGDDELPEDLPHMTLINRRSTELFFLERAFPNIPLFDGPLVEWPDWYFVDRRVLARVDAACRAEKRARAKSEAWVKAEERKMRQGK